MSQNDDQLLLKIELQEVTIKLGCLSPVYAS